MFEHNEGTCNQQSYFKKCLVAETKDVHVYHKVKTYLALQLLPIHTESSSTRGCQLAALPAVVVGVEDKSALIKALKQHHSH